MWQTHKEKVENREYKKCGWGGGRWRRERGRFSDIVLIPRGLVIAPYVAFFSIPCILPSNLNFCLNWPEQPLFLAISQSLIKTKDLMK
jgi:hypothetical protein